MNGRGEENVLKSEKKEMGENTVKQLRASAIWRRDSHGENRKKGENVNG